MIKARTMLGRSVSGGRLDRGGHFHAVESASTVSIAAALCGMRPGRLSPGWSPPEDRPVTCEKCAREVKRRRRANGTP